MEPPKHYKGRVVKVRDVREIIFRCFANVVQAANQNLRVDAREDGGGFNPPAKQPVVENGTALQDAQWHANNTRSAEFVNDRKDYQPPFDEIPKDGINGG